jgi:hypothetical protein
MNSDEYWAKTEEKNFLVSKHLPKNKAAKFPKKQNCKIQECERAGLINLWMRV